MINLAIDNFDSRGRPMPNGMHPKDCVLNFSTKWPYLDYPRLFYYFKESNIPCTISSTQQAPDSSWYLLTIGWFDFTTDYFKLVSPLAYTKIKNKQFKLIILYHEADNPKNISLRLQELSYLHEIDVNQVHFISGNSIANTVPLCHYWPALEYMYRRDITFTEAANYHTNKRTKKYTALVRIDKLWRSIFMANIWKEHLHPDGYFSYNQVDLRQDYDHLTWLNQEYVLKNSSLVDNFLKAGPFFVDTLTDKERNTYSVLTSDLYSNSYFNIILETFFNVDSSRGQFITEKTLKPILHNQFFILVGPQGSLSHLRELGYKTFSKVIDETYDTISDDQLRFDTVLALTKQLCNKSLEELHELYLELEPEIKHNRTVLQQDLSHRLKLVVNQIENQFAPQ
jgi:hypothetical protein